MKKVLFSLIAILSLSAAFLSFKVQDANAPAPVAKLSPGYVAEYTFTTAGASTNYHTIVGWFWQPCDLGIQINANELTGTTTMDVTLQATNDLSSSSPTWIDLWSPAAWSADEDTIINVANTSYGMYRLKWVQAGAGTWTPTSWLIVKE